MQFRFLVVMWNIYAAHISIGHSYKCAYFKRILFIQYPVKCKQKIFKFSLFLSNFLTVLLLGVHPLMESIIFHTRRPNNQEKCSYLLDIYVSVDVHFHILWSWDACFHINPFRYTSYVLKCFGCLEVSSRVSNWNKGKKLIFVGAILHNANWKYKQLEIQVFIYKLMCQGSLWISFSYEFCEFNRVSNGNKVKIIILVRSSIQICLLEILSSYSTWKYVKCKHVCSKD